MNKLERNEIEQVRESAKTEAFIPAEYYYFHTGQLLDALDEMENNFNCLQKHVKVLRKVVYGHCYSCVNRKAGCTDLNEFICANGGLIPGATNEWYAHQYQFDLERFSAERNDCNG